MPLEVLRWCARGLRHGQTVAAYRSRAALADARLGVELLHAGFNGARSNLEGKISSLTDTRYIRSVVDEIARLSEEAAAAFEHAFSVTWARVPWSRGSWRAESTAALDALKPLQQPDGRVHFAGDYMTDMSLWMQGALDSARAVSTAVHTRASTRA